MKSRQTFTISPEVSTRAKNYARRKGISLSSLVEQLLREKTGADSSQEEGSGGRVSFSSRWAGTGRLTGKNDARTRRLREKYDLSSK